MAYHPLKFGECIDIYHKITPSHPVLANSMMYVSGRDVQQYVIAFNSAFVMGVRRHGIGSYDHIDIFLEDDNYFNTWIKKMRNALELDRMSGLRLPSDVKNYSEEEILRVLCHETVDKMIALRKPRRIPFTPIKYPLVRGLEIEASSTEKRGEMQILIKADKEQNEDPAIITLENMIAHLAVQ